MMSFDNPLKKSRLLSGFFLGPGGIGKPGGTKPSAMSFCFLELCGKQAKAMALS